MGIVAFLCLHHNSLKNTLFDIPRSDHIEVFALFQNLSFATDLIKSVPVNAKGFAFMASIVLQLLKRKHSYEQTGVMLAPRRYGKSSLSLRKILSVIRTMTWLFWDINIAERFRRVQQS